MKTPVRRLPVILVAALWIAVSSVSSAIAAPVPEGERIPVMFSAVWDADGNFIELNRIMGTPAGINR